MSEYYEAPALGTPPLSVRDTWGEDDKIDAVAAWKQRVRRTLISEGKKSTVILVSDGSGNVTRQVILAI